jgi:hypothetical protein
LIIRAWSAAAGETVTGETTLPAAGGVITGLLISPGAVEESPWRDLHDALLPANTVARDAATAGVAVAPVFSFEFAEEAASSLLLCGPGAAEAGVTAAAETGACGCTPSPSSGTVLEIWPPAACRGAGAKSIPSCFGAELRCANLGSCSSDISASSLEFFFSPTTGTQVSVAGAETRRSGVTPEICTGATSITSAVDDTGAGAGDRRAAASSASWAGTFVNSAPMPWETISRSRAGTPSGGPCGTSAFGFFSSPPVADGSSGRPERPFPGV